MLFAYSEGGFNSQNVKNKSCTPVRQKKSIFLHILYILFSNASKRCEASLKTNISKAQKSEWNKQLLAEMYV